MTSLVRSVLPHARRLFDLPVGRLEALQPVLLAPGLGGRFAAAGLSVVNVVAVLSLSEIAPAALQQHQSWGALLLLVLLWGPGRWSADAWLARRWRA